jgi:hypothetical protein
MLHDQLHDLRKQFFRTFRFYLNQNPSCHD